MSNADTAVRIPTRKKLLWQILELAVALRVIEEFSLKQANYSLRQALRSSVSLFYCWYGATDLCFYADFLCSQEVSFRDLSWLRQAEEGVSWNCDVPVLLALFQEVPE